jgi:DNA-binding IclR family transcriptional regulator
VQSIERAAAVLRLLAAASDALSLAEVSTSLGLAKGTAHGILSTLRLVGFVHQDRTSGRYRLGEGLLELASRRIDPHDLRSLATNLADSLAARSGHTVRLGVLRAGQVLVVHHVFRPDNTPQTLDVGSLLPAHATALGKTLLAFDRASAPSLSPGLERYTRRTITDPQELRKALSDARTKGWAGAVAEYRPGQAAVAAPVRGHGGLLAGAIGVCGPLDRICDPQGHPYPTLVTMVRDTARAVSHELGDAR